MSSDQYQDEAIEILQELGLKEYEAKSFVALSRLPKATAKKVSEIAAVPRTRVYDAVRVLEAKGLVEVQHSNPQEFRAVPIDEAVASLEEQYEARVETLHEALAGVEPIETDEESITQEIWALGGTDAVANRTQRLLGEADDEVVFVVAADELLTDDLLGSLADVPAETDLVVGVMTEAARDRIRESVPDAKVFVTGLDWLHGRSDGEEAAIGRLLLVDRQTILVSSLEHDGDREMAIFGRGFGNGLVVIARRLMATGLIPAEDPGQS